MTRILILSAVATAAMLIAGCTGGGGDTAETADSAAPPTAKAEPETKPTEKAEEPAKAGNPLMDPSSLNAQAPATFKAKFETTKGDIVIQFNREWAPLGVDRVFNLIGNGYYDNARFYRVLTGFMAQFGMHADPKINAAWQGARFKDDPVTQSNTRGMVTFATGGPNTRTTQLFINYGNNAGLDKQGFSPIGEVIEGMEAADALYAAYGEGAPRGSGPSQQIIAQRGNAYLEADFPKLDYIKKASIVK